MRALSAQTYNLEEFLAPTVKRSHKLLNLESDHSESNNTTIEDKQNITFELAYEINWINYSCLKVKSMVWQLSLRLQRLVPNLKMSGLLRTIEVEKFFFNAADRTNSLKCAGQNCKSVSVYRLRNMGAVCRQVCGPKAVDSSEILTHNLHNTYMLEGRGSYQRSHLLFWLPEDS